MAVKKKMDKNLLYYKQKPVFRKDKVIFYGEKEEPFFVRLDILSIEKIIDIDVSTKITVTLMERQGEDAAKAVKNTEKEGLYPALEIAAIWLYKALGEEMENK